MVASKTKDYYKTLGIDKGADEKAIKAAFKKLARKHHPDMNKGDLAAEDRFKEVNEAFNVVSDPSSRKLYDRYGSEWERYKEAGFTGDEPAAQRVANFGGAGTRSGGYYRETSGDDSGFSDIIGSMFGNRNARDPFASSRSRRHKGQDLEVKVEVSFDEAFAGSTRRLDIKAPEPCTTCDGLGYARGSMCPTCDGSGEALKAKTIEVKIPAGVATGSRVRISGKGGPGVGGAAAGDVWINIEVRPDTRFERSGDDLKTEVETPLYTAVLGGEIVVTTPTGKVALAVPAGSQPGRVFRLRGQGMPKLKAKDSSRGDLLARLKVVVPSNLTEREQELFAELAAIRSS